MITTDISRPSGPACPVPTQSVTFAFAQSPFAVEGLAAGAIRAIPMSAERTNGPTKKTTLRSPAGIPRSVAVCAARATLALAYIRSIMALPKPEHETWVEPGMSRAKS